MKKSEIFDRILFYYEDRYEFINDKMYKKILNEIIHYEPEYQSVLSHLFGSNEAKFNSIHNKILEDQEHINLFYHQIKQTNYQFFHSLLWFISDICNVSYQKTENYLIELFCRSPYINSIKKEENIFIIDSIYGNIEFQKASSYFTNLGSDKLIRFIQSENLGGFCHYSTWNVTEKLKNSFAYTALLPQSFNGTFYHSFTIHQDQCIDLNYNCVIPASTYVKLIKPYVIQKIAHEELQKKKLKFKQYGDNFLIYSALDKQAKDPAIQKKLKFTYK